jgi:hypothetical protein
MSKLISPRDQITVTVKQEPKLMKLLEDARKVQTINLSAVIRQVLVDHLPEALKRAGLRS